MRGTGVLSREMENDRWLFWIMGTMRVLQRNFIGCKKMITLFRF